MGGPSRGHLCWGGSHPPEENADLPGIHPEHAHLLLQGVHGYLPHHNDRLHLDGRIADDAAWKRRCRRLAAQSASWYATPSIAVGRRFTAILSTEWRGFLAQSWNYKRTLIFAHIILSKTLGVCRAREIQARITRRMELWERGLHVDLVGDAKAEETA